MYPLLCNDWLKINGCWRPLEGTFEHVTVLTDGVQ